MSLSFGAVRLGTPVVLAPMAGVTNPPFRRLCREAGEAGLRSAERSVPQAASDRDPAGRPPPERSARHGVGSRGPCESPFAPSGLYVTEMITSRALVERTTLTMKMIAPDPDDPVRSVQLYGVDPATVGAAVRILVDEDRADHIDLNFGCPVPKVTRKGGGAALPWKKDLFSAIVTEAVRAAGHVPVTVKMRMGIDDDHMTFLDAGRIAQGAGVAAVALHARTAAQHYSGNARWDAISRLKEELREVPVLGNGDIWSAEDAARMMSETGCDGVVIGRGCQGRPWLFTDVVAAMHGHERRVRPGLAQVAAVLRRHAEYMVEHFEEEHRAIRELRKHMAWYLKGYRVGGEARHALGMVSSLAELDERLGALDLAQPYPGADAEGQRGRAGGEKIPRLPEGWLDSPHLNTAQREQIAAAELDVSGG